MCGSSTPSTLKIWDNALYHSALSLSPAPRLALLLFSPALCLSGPPHAPVCSQWVGVSGCVIGSCAHASLEPADVLSTGQGTSPRLANAATVTNFRGDPEGTNTGLGMAWSPGSAPIQPHPIPPHHRPLAQVTTLSLSLPLSLSLSLSHTHTHTHSHSSQFEPPPTPRPPTPAGVSPSGIYPPHSTPPHPTLSHLAALSSPQPTTTCTRCESFPGPTMSHPLVVGCIAITNVKISCPMVLMVGAHVKCFE
jgi:hypothetical protein